MNLHICNDVDSSAVMWIVQEVIGVDNLILEGLLLSATAQPARTALDDVVIQCISGRVPKVVVSINNIGKDVPRKLIDFVAIHHRFILHFLAPVMNDD